jgi:hypothetical protein
MMPTSRHRFAVLGLALALLLMSSGDALGLVLIIEEVEHNWTVTVGGEDYGLRQTVLVDYDIRRTTIYLGQHTLSTRLRAPWIAAIVAVALAAFVVMVALVAMSWNSRRATQDRGDLHAR